MWFLWIYQRSCEIFIAISFDVVTKLLLLLQLYEVKLWQNLLTGIITFVETILELTVILKGENLVNFCKTT